ncbi:MAG: hypothetical protein WBQ94_09430 [Terracidiphilus sp.]
MKRSTTVFVVFASLMAILLVFGIYGLFRGYFDGGTFEIKQIQWSSSKQVAVLAERSDKQSLGGLTYFVIVDDHVLSPAELKLAYHSNAVIFDAMATCINLHWESPNRLIVACNGSYLNQEYINVEKRQNREVTISYVNISPNTAQTFSPK